MKRRDNVTTYVRFRGDRSFKEDPFNEIDALIFTLLCYFDFNGIVPYDDKEVSIVDAYNAILALETDNETYEKKHIRKHDEEVDIFTMEEGNKPHKHRSLKAHERELLGEAARSKRFGDVMLSHFCDELDPTLTEQFSAVHFRFTKHDTFIAFRGTDDTLVGWKENFMMLYKEHVAGQVRAVSYLNETIPCDLKHIFDHYYIGGHSKGGNLAMYGCFYCQEEVIKKVKALYSFDGPGFSQPFEDMPRYHEIKDRMMTFTPKFSAIGLCMDHYRKDYTVDSFYEGMNQHDGYSWIVNGKHFLLATRDKESVKVEKDFKDWVHSMDAEEKEKFVNAFFQLLEKAGCNSASDFLDINVGTLVNILKTMVTIPAEERDQILKVALAIWTGDRKIKVPDVAALTENIKEKIPFDKVRHVFKELPGK